MPQPSAYALKQRAERAQKGEKLSEYFDPSKAELVVRRFELQAILDRFMWAQQHNKWHHRVWRAIQRYFMESARAPVKEPEQ